jgi:hypothetical protein
LVWPAENTNNEQYEAASARAKPLAAAAFTRRASRCVALRIGYSAASANNSGTTLIAINTTQPMNSSVSALPRVFASRSAMPSRSSPVLVLAK